MKAVRCAIYTRKSSEEGLEQGFNSLDAQREACAAYILSQASEGWTKVVDHYDDGGLSGGTLERPALQRLLADIAAGRIDIVVVYKVDRLTRSLLDFSKLVEAFDAAGTSFVSVTQSFNTTTSMGRLTLNMLLSFAQFEREVTVERIRDKIAASKARGMWMGGVAPLGYRPNGRSLAIVDEHAALVRHIFDRYLVLGNVRLLEAELKSSSIKVPVRTTESGKPIGGGWFSRGLLHVMLRRVTYDGQIAHGDKVYVGSHSAIVDRDTFAKVQAMLAEHTQGERRGRRSDRQSALAGKIFADGEPLTPTHAAKNKTRYRYYVSRPLHLKQSDTGVRIPAREIETLVATQIAALVDDPISLSATARLDLPAHALEQVQQRCFELAGQLRGRNADALSALVERAIIHHDNVVIEVKADALTRLLGVNQHADAPSVLSLTAAARLARTGRAVQLIQPSGAAIAATPHASLLRQLLTARKWWSELKRGELDITRLAAREGVTPSYMTRMVRLAFLSPEVVAAIIAGKVRATVTVDRLIQEAASAWCWRQQRVNFLPAISDRQAA